MPISTFINAHKALVIPVVLALMWRFDDWSAAAFVYLSLHGTYALLWLLKHRLFPDRRFVEPKPLWIGVLFIFLPLGGYYIAPYILMSRHVQPSPATLAVVLCVYTLGMFLHYVSDAHKYYSLRLRSGLIQDGLFSRTRNPNYLGEILIYSAYGMLAQHWLPFVVLSAWVVGYFLPNMRRKDASMSRYPEFVAYQARTGLLFPRLRSAA